MIAYKIPPGIQNITVKNTPVILNQKGGKIVVDRKLISLWQAADGKSLAEIERYSQEESLPSGTVYLAVACLVVAGLLDREGFNIPTEEILNLQGSMVSVVIVSHNSLEWLESCLHSLFTQTYSPIEVIIVDNASKDGSVDWIETNYPQVSIIQIDETCSLSKAINRGVLAASGDYYLLLNPDVQLKSDAVAQMVKVASREQECAAVAAKLRFSWAPAFLNGLGNSVGSISWGIDNGLGHLDLGQFDNWGEVPSACFAAALIPKKAWRSVGNVDERFPLYYEDSEWSYRARMLGNKVLTAPQAVVYHAFGDRVPSGIDSELTPAKQRQVVYGRLRFVTKILGYRFLFRFLISYFVEDLVRSIINLFRGRWRLIVASFMGWMDYFMTIPVLRKERNHLQSRREVDDIDLFRMQKVIPMPLILNGLPQLTWDIVANIYGPLVESGNLHLLPEFKYLNIDITSSAPQSGISGFLHRMKDIIDSEGFYSFFHRGWRYVQWILRQP